ncbi:imidazole glycerol phosphate synthase subunit HisH [Limisalsivibrio acetivorans]|uniref:imidazole glycerol phosphate synthase subunit HisH n=1 Tax=Limisalsivibrio acetivorans TaxID=1304888 RepID=UPI0003B39313|nr:imidazole glycerol phosphate synthase subunit HisH [Limisalsivibrio acetivorans]
MIAVIDYGMGNLRSVQKALESLGYNAVVTSCPKEIIEADRAILPGVGAFGDCLAGLREMELYDATLRFIDTGKPFLGICVGMQMLFEKSYEFGEHEGIGLFKGSVKKFPDILLEKGMKIPHMGWSEIIIRKEHPLLKDIEDRSRFYFVHSYYAEADNSSSIAAECEYGVRFTAMAAKDNIAATQFHPEKSQKLGLQMLKNFGEWKC